MVATRTQQETPTVDSKVEARVPKIEPKDIEPEEIEPEEIELEERVVLPWYRRVPAPGLTGLRHYPGYGKRR